MYTGNLIDELIATVERAETSIHTQPEPEFQLAYRYVIALNELANLDTRPQFAGVA
ncbi:MAG TPA: hypothetical protein VHV29_16090 [Terriglobales bacterium]|jgi:hypothetical protein|nr:hypothetical protein [Terriglobales bacterium]